MKAVINIISFILIILAACQPVEKTSIKKVTEAKSSVTNLKYELPAITDSATVVSHLAYTLSYAEKYEQASWVAYRLTKDMITGIAKRTDDFRADPYVKTGSATPEDYRRSGYDRGHLAPAADMSWNDQAMRESFYMSNMSPQKPGFNRGIWKRLEEKVRDFVRENDTIYVVTGPILKDGLPTIGVDHVAVPKAYYKVIAVLRHNQSGEWSPDCRGIGFILANRSSNKKLESFAVTIDSVEAMTGLNFYANLPDNLQAKLESEHKLDKWIKN